MPLTHLPNGLSLRVASATPAAAGSGDLACVDAFISGTGSAAVIIANTVSAVNVIATGTVSAAQVIISTANTMVGSRAYIPFSFTSAAATSYYATPFDGNVLDVFVTCDTTPRTCSGLTIRAGTAGTVYVATDATLVFATAAGQQMKPTVTPAAITTASALQVVVTTAGSAANFQGMIVLVRTA